MLNLRAVCLEAAREINFPERNHHRLHQYSSQWSIAGLERLHVRGASVGLQSPFSGGNMIICVGHHAQL
jgi:hypothetical protein